MTPLRWDFIIREARRDRDRVHYRKRYHANRKKISAQAKARYHLNRDESAAHGRAQYHSNRKNVLAHAKARYHANRQKFSARAKAFYRANAAVIKKRMKERRQSDPRWKETQRNRYATDPQFRLSLMLRARIRIAFKLGAARKSASTETLIGCTIPQLIAHLESKFLPGMSWEQRGKIHIDHVRPCVIFDLTDPAQQHECFHFSNLQPLWKGDNLRKQSMHNGVMIRRKKQPKERHKTETPLPHSETLNHQLPT